MTPGFSDQIPDPGKLKFKDMMFYESTIAGIQFQANYLNAHAFITNDLLQPEIPVPDSIKHLVICGRTDTMIPTPVRAAELTTSFYARRPASLHLDIMKNLWKGALVSM